MKKELKVFIGLCVIVIVPFMSYLFLVDEKRNDNNKIINSKTKQVLRTVARFMTKSKVTEMKKKIPDSNPGKGSGRNFIGTDFHQKRYTIVNTSKDDIFIDYSNTESLESFICASGSGATGNNKFTSYDGCGKVPKYNKNRSTPYQPTLTEIKFIEIERAKGEKCDESDPTFGYAKTGIKQCDLGLTCENNV